MFPWQIAHWTPSSSLSEPSSSPSSASARAAAAAADAASGGGAPAGGVPSSGRPTSRSATAPRRRRRRRRRCGALARRDRDGRRRLRPRAAPRRRRRRRGRGNGRHGRRGRGRHGSAGAGAESPSSKSISKRSGSAVRARRGGIAGAGGVDGPASRRVTGDGGGSSANCASSRGAILSSRLTSTPSAPAARRTETTAVSDGSFDLGRRGVDVVAYGRADRSLVRRPMARTDAGYKRTRARTTCRFATRSRNAYGVRQVWHNSSTLFLISQRPPPP